MPHWASLELERPGLPFVSTFKSSKCSSNTAIFLSDFFFPHCYFIVQDMMLGYMMGTCPLQSVYAGCLVFLEFLSRTTCKHQINSLHTDDFYFFIYTDDILALIVSKLIIVFYAELL